MSLVDGTGGNDTLLGTTDGDEINGFDGDDLLDGKGGDDTLDGGPGQDQLTGGIGNDIVHGGDGSDEFLADGAYGDDQLFGGAGDDSFRETIGNDTLFGGGGNDHFRVEYNDFTVIATGGLGQDTYGVFRPPTPAQIHDYRVTDFAAGPGGDRIDIADLLIASSTLGYAGGNPFAQGFVRLVQSDADTLLQWDRDGAAGNVYTSWETVLTLQNRVSSSLTADNFAGGIPPDGSAVPGQTITGTSGDDGLAGGFFDDQLDGLDGNDTLTGGGGDDSVDGGPGNDVIYGGFGTDAVYGGMGSDTYSFASLPGLQSVVVAMDFDAGADRVDVYPLLSTSAGMGYAGGNPFAQGFLRLQTSGGDMLLQWDRDGAGGAYDWATVLALKDVASSSIGSANFVGAIPPDGSTPAPLTIDGSAGADTLVGGVAGDRINGLDGNDYLLGEWGDDTLGGGPGNDLLIGGAGNDLVLGGKGDDGFSFGLTPDGFVDPSSTAGDDTLVGGAGNDTFLDFTGDNTFDGREGDDVFIISFDNVTGAAIGGTGIDTYRPEPVVVSRDYEVTDFQAGAGGDLLHVEGLLGISEGYGGGNPFTKGYLRLLQSGPDALVQWDLDGASGGAYGWATQLTLQGIDAPSITSDNFVGRLILGTETDDNLLAGPGNDTLVGLGGADTLDGAGGKDSLEGGSGNDLYYVYSLDEIIVESSNAPVGAKPLAAEGALAAASPLAGVTDTVIASIDYSLAALANVENLTLDGTATSGTGNALDNEMVGNALANNLSGAEGNDSILGGEGNDTLQGNQGSDTLRGGLGDDELRGGQTGDFVYSGQGNDQVFGAKGHDELRGGMGNDTISSGQGNDTLYGGADSDLLQGRLGNDVLTGGSGADRFWFNIAGTTDADTILDFEAGVDKIQLDPAYFTTNTFGVNILYDSLTGDISYDADGAAGGELLIAAVAAGTGLSAGDFLVG